MIYRIYSKPRDLPGPHITLEFTTKSPEEAWAYLEKYRNAPEWHITHAKSYKIVRGDNLPTNNGGCK